MEWISVKDRLPESDDQYLVFAQFECDEESSIYIFDYDSCAEEFGVWEEHYDSDMLGYLDSEFVKYPATVLYWMPLPEPPKEEKA